MRIDPVHLFYLLVVQFAVLLLFRGLHEYDLLMIKAAYS